MFYNFVLRSSLDMWCSQKQRLQSVSSGKEVLWCAELLGSGFRSDRGEDGLPHVICETFAKGAREADGWSAGTVLPQLNLRRESCLSRTPNCPSSAQSDFISVF